MEVSDVRPALRRLGLTQQALADHLGVHKGDLSALLSGKRRMTLDTFRKIEAFLSAAERPASGVAETPAPAFEHRPNIKWITFEEALALRDNPAPRLSDEEYEHIKRRIIEVTDAFKDAPRVTDMTDDEILGYDEMP